MGNDCTLTTHWLDSIDSTQRYLLEALKNKQLEAPICIATNIQHDGSGSRGNLWKGVDGNLFFSFAIRRDTLPTDLKLESSSIYFTYILKEILEEAGSKVWLKWPNDFYLENKKIGGALTNIHKDILICGIGLNTKYAPQGFERLDIKMSQKHLLETYFKKLSFSISWKQIFSKYQIEFDRSKMGETTIGHKKISLNDAVLFEDGSIECNGQRMYSLR